MAKNSLDAVNFRREELLRFLALNQNSSLSDISSRFGTSEMTIRRDLRVLSEKGLISKGIGNLYSLNCDPAFDPKYFFRYSTNRPKKLAIAAAAVELIPSGSFLFLDSGTTVLELAKQLSHLDSISIVTNNLYIPMYISQRPGSTKIDFLGGDVDLPSMSTNGIPACKRLEGYHADLVFFSADGVDLTHGVTTKEYSLVDIKKAMLSHAEKKILLVDSSKMNACSIKAVATLDEIDVLVTDWEVPAAMLAQLKEIIPQVIVAQPR